MNIWNLKSAVIIWIFAWVWLAAFDSCAPARERWSVSNGEAVARREARQEQQEISDAEHAADLEKLCAIQPDAEACQAEVSIMCKIFTCEE